MLLKTVQGAWVLFFLAAVVILLSAVPARYANLSTVNPAGETGIGDLSPADVPALAQAGWSVHAYALYFTVLETIVAVVFFVSGLVLFWFQRTSRMALFTAFALVAFGLNSSPLIDALPFFNPAWDLPITIIRSLALILLILLFFLFPNGQFVPGWTRGLAVIWILYNLAWPFIPQIVPPVRLIHNNLAERLAFLWLALFILLGVLLQVYRFRSVSTPAEKQQTRWVIAGFVFFMAVSLVATIIVIFTQALSDSAVLRVQVEILAFTLVLINTIGLGISFVVASLRYRLFDIDLVIRKTLVYSILTLLLVVFYAGGVILLQQIFQPADSGDQSPLAVVIVTLGLAALFNPLRVRIQKVIDRRFYRRAYDMQAALDRFSQQASNELQIQQLAGHILNSVRTTLEPSRVSLWLIDPQDQ